MGTLQRFRLDAERFPILIETGTGRGGGIRYAIDQPFRHVLSVDTEELLVTRAQQMFANDKRVKVEHGESVPFLEQAFKDLDSNVGVICWLDAHFPGSDVLGVPYDSEKNIDRRLPLQRELEIIGQRHPRSIVIIDDYRLYEDGPYTNGCVTLSHVGLTLGERKVAAASILNALRETHELNVLYQDEGYLVFTPIGEEPPELIKFGVREYTEAARRYVEVGDHFTAKTAYAEVLNLTDPPDTPLKRIARGEACQFMAAEARAASNDGTSIDWWHKALMADPLDMDCRIDFILKGLIPLQWMDLARVEVERAQRIDAKDPRVWQVSANIEREAGDAEAAKRFVDKALELGPDNAGSHLIAAQFYADTSSFEEALVHYERVIALEPRRRAEALHGMAIVRDRQGRTEEALTLFDEVMERGLPDRDDMTLARWNRSEMLLALGRYEEGWKDHSIRFDDRYRGRELAAFGRLGRRFKAPFWGLDDKPCRLHVHSEMGFGDVICMARYVPKLIEMGHDVRFEVDPHLVDLFKDSFSGVKVQPFALDYPGALGLAEFDEHVTTMAFPNVFGTRIDTVPWDGPYIKADPERSIITFTGDRFKVGLCWSAGIRPGLWYSEYGRRKSMRFADLAPLLSIDASFIALQAGPERLENSILPGIQEEKPDWADTAALIANLDLVITVDTAVAHLTGAMGKPTWLMMHTQGSWHWMRDRLDSPWYPSVRIFRQEKPHEWRPVVDAVAEALRSEVAR